MPAYKIIALAGVGGLGGFVLSALAEKDVSVKVLSRKDSPNKPTLPSNAQLTSVDYSSAKDLQDALRGVDVLISTLPFFAALKQQENLARAAKAAGVHLFIPSEFGSPSNEVKTGLLTQKSMLHPVLEELNLPHVLVFTGPFPEVVISPYFGFDFPSKVTVYGDGRQPVAWTSRASVASFLAGVLTTSSVPALPRLVRLEGNRASFLDIGALYEKVKGVKLTVEKKPISELDEKLANNSQDALAWTLKECAEGRAGVGEPNGKNLWPEWEPEMLEDILKTL